MSEAKRMEREFEELCELLPADVYWSDPITPETMKEIRSAVISQQLEFRGRVNALRQVAEKLADAAALVLMRAAEQPGPFKLLIDGGSLSEALAAYKVFKQGDLT